MSVYLNNNATTFMPPVVCKEINKWFNSGNASVDMKSKELIDNSKKLISKFNNAPLDNYEIIFTSCASESNSTIINAVASQSKNKNIITSSIEHNSILKALKALNNIKVKIVEPDKYGLINPEDVEKLIDSNTILISIMYMNNEIGSINNVKEIGRIANKSNIIFHCDAVQMYGKCRINIQKMNIDVLSASFHKLYGPPGIGLLIMSKTILRKHNVDFVPLIAGSQNNNLRGGTENIPYIAGAISALRWNFHNRKEKNQKICKLMEYLKERISSEYLLVNYADFSKTLLNDNKVVIVYYGHKSDKEQSCNTILLSIGSNRVKVCNIKMKKYLESKNLILGIGSACNASNKKSSHVLFSLNVPPVLRRGTLRVSLGDYNNMNEIKLFCDVYLRMINKMIK